MQAVKIKLEDSYFLLPESHSGNYEFPNYINENKDDILACIFAYKTWIKSPLEDMQPTPDMSEFKKKTGIIGAPFNMHDVDLYILDRSIDVVLEVEL